MYTIEAINIFIFLIPGFISAKILNSISVREGKSEFGKIVEALIFTMIIYTVYSIIFNDTPITLTSFNETYKLSYNAVAFFLLFGLSLLLPIIISIFITNDWHMKLARKFRVTKKTSRHSVWLDVFYDTENPIIVNFSDGRRIWGWPQYYSDNYDSNFLFLYHPAWIIDGEVQSIESEGILITPEAKIDTIEFRKLEEEKKDE